MRLAARGGIFRSGMRGLQGKFCLCLEFVLFSCRDDFQPDDDPAFRR